MSKRMMTALVLLGVVALVLILTGVKTGGSVSVHVVYREIHAATALVLLAFTALGVLIGSLLK